MDIDTWNRLGHRTFWLFLYQKLEVPASFLFLAVLATIGRSFSGLHPAATAFLGLAGAVCIVIFIVSLAVALLWSWLVYRSYGYLIGEDALRIKQGVFTTQELAIPYRQIQDVEIERTLSNRMIGLSKIVIVTAGHDDAHTPGVDESAGVLPAMDRERAASLQIELLHRAEVQKVVETKQ